MYACLTHILGLLFSEHYVGFKFAGDISSHTKWNRVIQKDMSGRNTASVGPGVSKYSVFKPL